MNFNKMSNLPTINSVKTNVQVKQYFIYNTNCPLSTPLGIELHKPLRNYNIQRSVANPFYSLKKVTLYLLSFILVNHVISYSTLIPISFSRPCMDLYIYNHPRSPDRVFNTAGHRYLLRREVKGFTPHFYGFWRRSSSKCFFFLPSRFTFFLRVTETLVSSSSSSK